MKRVGIIADCQQLFFMNENAPITLQTDASDSESGGYLFQTVDGLIQVILCISKVLEDLLKHVRFHLKTDHTGQVARLKIYMQDWNFTVSYLFLGGCVQIIDA